MEDYGIILICERKKNMGDFPSGQRGQTVNLLAKPSVVRIHHRPFKLNNTHHADVAQLAEQLICNQQVIGSSPIIGFLDGFPSGQRGQTVNLLQHASVVRIHLHPYAGVAELADAQDLKSCGTYTPVPVRFRSAAVLFRL